MCSPLAHASISLGVASSIRLPMDRSLKETLPAPPPPPPGGAGGDVIPQLHDRTSISPACLESFDSPLMPSTLRKMSTAMRASRSGPDGAARQEPNRMQPKCQTGFAQIRGISRGKPRRRSSGNMGVRRETPPGAALDGTWIGDRMASLISLLSVAIAMFGPKQSAGKGEQHGVLREG